MGPIHMAKTQAKLSPLILKSLGKGLQRSENKSVWPECVSGEILKLGGEAMIPYLARLLDITMNNDTLPGYWKRATVIPIHKGDDRSLVTNYRPLSLYSLVCKRMEHVITSYLRQMWDKNDWLYEGQHGFGTEYSCEIQVVTVCQDISDSLDNGDRIEAIIIDFSTALDLVSRGRLLMKIANSGVDSREVVWIREFLLGRTQRVRIGGQLSEEFRVTSGVSQGSVLGPILFLAYVNGIWGNIEPSITLFGDDCVIYRKIIANEDIETLQKNLCRLGEWAVETAMKINPSKSKVVRFTRARVKNPLSYSLTGHINTGSEQLKYIGIILYSDLSWADQVNYTVKKVFKALRFTMRILRKGNSNTKSLAYM